MGLLRRDPIFLTCCLILLLACAEGWLAWHYLHGMQGEGRAARIAVLERQLRAKQAEIDHLIFLRDGENRQSREAIAQARALARSAAERARGDEDLTANEMLNEELFEATTQTAGAPARQQASRRPLERGATPPSQAYPMLPGFPVPSDDDVVDAPQGAAPLPTEPEALTPADIDPKQLVKMANLMNGRSVAELTRMKGQTLIRYHGTRLGADDPIWHLLDAVTKAHALREILLVGKDAADEARLKRLAEAIASSGVPSPLIRIKTGDADYLGLEGILIEIRRKS